MAHPTQKSILWESFYLDSFDFLCDHVEDQCDISLCYHLRGIKF